MMRSDAVVAGCLASGRTSCDRRCLLLTARRAGLCRRGCARTIPTSIRCCHQGFLGRRFDNVETAVVRDARRLAGLCLASVRGPRWAHVQAVGQAAEGLMPEIGERVVVAAWLHDVGYGTAKTGTGLHPLDGARFLRRQGMDTAVVSLVAYHSGASFEAVERGLTAELGEFPPPSAGDLDALTLVDMTTGPDGSRMPVSVRISEILSRYGPEHPVHRAVSRAQPELMASVARAARRLGLPDEGFAPPL